MTTNVDELLTTAEVADIVRAPAGTLRYWRHRGIGPRHFKIGRRVVYRRSELEAWIARCENQFPEE